MLKSLIKVYIEIQDYKQTHTNNHVYEKTQKYSVTETTFYALLLFIVICTYKQNKMQWINI